MLKGKEAMIFHSARFLARTLVVALLAPLVWPCNAVGQNPRALNNPAVRKDGPDSDGPTRDRNGADNESWTANYADPAQGVSSGDLVRRALQSNAELAATRLDYERARARLRQ